MKHLEPNVILIDDHKEEIEDILFYYQDRGIGCKLYNPDYVEGDDMPEKSFSDVSIVFLDLFYSGKFDAEQCSNWIRSIIKEKSFYILVLWSKDISKAEEVIELLKLHHRNPFIKIIKSKTDYPTKTGKKYDFSLLMSEIDNQLDQIPALEEIQIWKNCLKSSSNIVIGNITKDSDQITNKLKKIIVGHGGLSIKEANNSERKRSVLFDALDTVLISNTKINIDCDVNQLNKDTLYDLANIENVDVDKELNSWFHFKLENNLSHDSISPGLIAYNNHSLFKKIYSIKDDEKIAKLLQKQNLVEIDDVVLIISRPCDVAQQKFGKNIKLLSGIIINKPARKKNEIDFGGAKLPDYVKIYDHLQLDKTKDDIAILFDFRYSFSIPQKIFIDKFENIKIFNKELLSEMQVEYSGYSSRLGITQII